MTNRHTCNLVIVAFVLLLLTACTASYNPLVGEANAEGDIAGFWLGLWHGFICLITFFLSLFAKSIAIYEVHNNGGWYDFGFLLGASFALGSSILFPWRRKRC